MILIGYSGVYSLVYMVEGEQDDPVYPSQITSAWTKLRPFPTINETGVIHCRGAKSCNSIIGSGEHFVRIELHWNNVIREDGAYPDGCVDAEKTIELENEYWHYQKGIYWHFEGHRFLSGNFVSKLYIDGELYDEDTATYTEEHVEWWCEVADIDAPVYYRFDNQSQQPPSNYTLWEVILDSNITSDETNSSDDNFPVPQFTYTPNPPEVDKTIFFIDQSTDNGTIISWTWNFGDGTSSIEQNPHHIYDSTGEYNVSLIVADDEGLTAMIKKNIVIGYPDQLPLP
jgi:hypothetical protein